MEEGRVRIGWGVSNVKQLICSLTVSGCGCVLFVCMDV